MSTETPSTDKKSDPQATPAASTPAAVKKSSPFGALLRIVVPALFAAGAAYGGTRASGAKAAPAPETEHSSAAKPPGPTLPLEPFLVTILDANKKPHPMRMSLAVEFDPHVKEDLKNFTPRIRDAVLSHLRTVMYEQASDPNHIEKLRAELVERCKASGAPGAERILVTDFVVQ